MLAHIAPLALLLPFSPAGEATQQWLVPGAQLDPREVELASEPGAAPAMTLDLEWLHPREAGYQVRIERRVTIRIAPRSRAPRQSLMAELPHTAQPTRFEERPMEKCLPIESIAGVQTGSGDRLVLFLRDRRMVSARLEKACRARDFYSGFYLESSKDGMLCVERDKLQSRAGANCELDRMRELVPIYD